MQITSKYESESVALKIKKYKPRAVDHYNSLSQ